MQEMITSIFRPEFIGKEVINVIRKADSGTVWLIQGGEEARQVYFPGRYEMLKSK